MEVKFGNDEGAAAVDVQTATTPATPTKPAPAAAPANTTTAVATTGQSAFKLGDRLPGFKDVILPRLNLVHNTGELKDTFQPGAFVFDKSTVLFTPPIIDTKAGTIIKPGMKPVTIYVVGIVSERFSEKIEGGIGGEIVDTEADVRAAGGTINYKEWELKRDEGLRRFEELVELLLVIEKPEGVNDESSLFSFDVDNKKVTLGFWSCKGTTYTHAVKTVFNRHRLMGVLKGGYYTHSFSLTSRVEVNKKKGFNYWIPVVVPKAPTSPAMLEFIRGIVNA